MLAAREEPGEANSESRVELVGHRGGVGRYRLLPTTGRTHQLRVHMNALGLPIVHDPLYPVVEGKRPLTTSRGRCSCWPVCWSSPIRSAGSRAAS